MGGKKTAGGRKNNQYSIINNKFFIFLAFLKFLFYLCRANFNQTYMKVQFLAIYNVQKNFMSHILYSGIEVTFKENLSALEKTNLIIKEIVKKHNKNTELNKYVGKISADNLLLQSLTKLN